MIPGLGKKPAETGDAENVAGKALSSVSSSKDSPHVVLEVSDGFGWQEVATSGTYPKLSLNSDYAQSGPTPIQSVGSDEIRVRLRLISGEYGKMQPVGETGVEFFKFDPPRIANVRFDVDASRTLVNIGDFEVLRGYGDSGMDEFVPPWNSHKTCLLYTSPSPRDATLSRMPSSA